MSLSLDIFRSFVFSLDALLALLIYFGSKLVNVHRGESGISTRFDTTGNSSMILGGVSEIPGRRRSSFYDSGHFSIGGGDDRGPVSSYHGALRFQQSLGRSAASLSADRSSDNRNQKSLSSTSTVEEAEMAPLCPKCRALKDEQKTEDDTEPFSSHTTDQQQSPDIPEEEVDDVDHFSSCTADQIKSADIPEKAENDIDLSSSHTTDQIQAQDAEDDIDHSSSLNADQIQSPGFPDESQADLFGEDEPDQDYSFIVEV